MDKVEFQITDGSVEYKHSKPRAEYETVAPLVRLNFTIAEGSDPDAVVRKVMGMAVRHVEGVLTGEVKSVPQKTLNELAKEQPDKFVSEDELVGKTPRRGRPPKTVEPETIGFEEGNVEPEGGNEDPILTLKGDIQPLAQKVSAHLAKVDGNINKLRAVIKECGGNSLLNIPQANWSTFITKAKELLP